MISPEPSCQTIEVDAVHGNDANAGDCDAPFKTITHALAVAPHSGVITLEPGVYDAANGETFPLHVGDVDLQGDVGANPSVRTSRGMAPLTKIVGEIVVEAGFTRAAEVSDLWLEGSIRGDLFGIVNATVTGGGTGGICIQGSDSVTVTSVTVSGCFGYGVLMRSGRMQIAGSTLTGSAINLEALSPASVFIDFGAPFNMPNTFSCATTADIVTNIDLDAANNAWDHVPPTRGDGIPSGGIDVSTTDANVAVSTANATLASPNCS